MALGEIKQDQDPTKLIQIEVKERLEHPLKAVIEPEIGRTFGIVVSEDDFSPIGKMEYKPASVNAKKPISGKLPKGWKWLGSY